jgi:hypothetical protein
MEYKHIASANPRPVSDKLDIGAYQASPPLTPLSAGSLP